jgi:hypothetical protein
MNSKVENSKNESADDEIESGNENSSEVTCSEEEISVCGCGCCCD